MTQPPARWAHQLIAALICLASAQAVQADQEAGSAPLGSPADATPPVNARLDFEVRIDKMLYLCVGACVAGSVDSLSNNQPLLQSGINASPSWTTPVPGNDQPLGWIGTAPPMAMNTSGLISNSVPIRLQANTGPIQLRVETLQPMTHMSNPALSIPMSRFTLNVKINALWSIEKTIPLANSGSTVALPITSSASLIDVSGTVFLRNQAFSPLPAAGDYEGLLRLVVESL
jgi:hypothetical protein